MLETISVNDQKRIWTEGGDVLQVISKNATGFEGFGEAYFSMINHSFIKGWKRHRRMTMNLVVPLGEVRFVFCHTEQNGKQNFRMECAGVKRYVRITVPPNIWFAFQGLSSPNSLILNIASIPHDPEEVERVPLQSIKCPWF